MILAFVLHVFGAVGLAVVLTWVTGQLSVAVAAISLLVSGVWAFRQRTSLLSLHPDWRWAAFSQGWGGFLEKTLTVFVLLACLRHFLWLLFPLSHNLSTLSANNFGDLPLHINIIRYLSSGISWPVHNPIFASEVLRYPMGIDLYNALWEQMGVPLTSHLFLIGIGATLASLVFLRSFAGWWGIGAFFLNGGLAGWSLFKIPSWFDASIAVEWKNFLLSVFITQRGMLAALPVGLLLLIAFRRHLSGEAVLNQKDNTTLGVLWGLLPLFHLHAFFIISVLTALMVLEFRGRSALKAWVGFRPLWVALGPASWFMWQSTHGFQAASVAHWSWGWMAPSGRVVEFFVYNFGPWLLLPIVIGVYLWRSVGWLPAATRRRLWVEYFVYLLCTILFLNLMLAPWNWDNIKILIWPYLGWARLAAVLLEPRLKNWVQLLVCFALFYSGSISVLKSLSTPGAQAVRLYSMAELANVEAALSKVPRDAVFSAVPTHDHPLTYFGRARALGYDGHLWSHGIEAGDVTKKHDALMSGDEQWRDLARELQVTHIFWGPAERNKYGSEEKPWMSELPNVSRVPEYQVYSLGESHREEGSTDG